MCYANSVIGARSNREGGPSALAAALTGVTPEYGMQLEEKRRPGVTIHVEATLQDNESLGPTVHDLAKLTLPQPCTKGGILCGQIIRVDNFANLVTNSSAQELTDFLQSDPLRIEAGDLVIRKLSRVYAVCEEGEPLALINSSNLLEISVNLGRASEDYWIEKWRDRGCPG